MNATDLNQAQFLLSEFNNLGETISLLEGSGKIVRMTVANPDDPNGVAVNTSGIDYPSQMVQTIKTAFLNRQNEIRNDLGKLGVTGLPTTGARR